MNNLSNMGGIYEKDIIVYNHANNLDKPKL